MGLGVDSDRRYKYGIEPEYVQSHNLNTRYRSTPIRFRCQMNFIVMLTDGWPKVGGEPRVDNPSAGWSVWDNANHFLNYQENGKTYSIPWKWVGPGHTNYDNYKADWGVNFIALVREQNSSDGHWGEGWTRNLSYIVKADTSNWPGAFSNIMWGVDDKLGYRYRDAVFGSGRFSNEPTRYEFVHPEGVKGGGAGLGSSVVGYVPEQCFEYYDFDTCPMYSELGIEKFIRVAKQEDIIRCNDLDSEYKQYCKDNEGISFDAAPFNKQTVTTHIIGFSGDNPFLRKAVERNGGQFIGVNSLHGLVDAMKTIFSSIQAAAEKFSGTGVIPVISDEAIRLTENTTMVTTTLDLKNAASDLRFYRLDNSGSWSTDIFKRPEYGNMVKSQRLSTTIMSTSKKGGGWFSFDKIDNSDLGIANNGDFGNASYDTWKYIVRRYYGAGGFQAVPNGLRERVHTNNATTSEKDVNDLFLGDILESNLIGLSYKEMQSYEFTVNQSENPMNKLAELRLRDGGNLDSEDGWEIVKAEPDPISGGMKVVMGRKVLKDKFYALGSNDGMAHIFKYVGQSALDKNGQPENKEDASSFRDIIDFIPGDSPIPVPGVGRRKAFNVPEMKALRQLLPETVKSGYNGEDSNKINFVNGQLRWVQLPTENNDLVLSGGLGTGGKGVFALNLMQSKTSPEAQLDPIDPMKIVGGDQGMRGRMILADTSNSLSKSGSIPEIGFVRNHTIAPICSDGATDCKMPDNMKAALDAMSTPAYTSKTASMLPNVSYTLVTGTGVNSTMPLGKNGVYFVNLKLDGTDVSYDKKFVPLPSDSKDFGVAPPATIDVNNDNVADYAYFGTEEGNVYRVDIAKGKMVQIYKGNYEKFNQENNLQDSDDVVKPIVRPPVFFKTLVSTNRVASSNLGKYGEYVAKVTVVVGTGSDLYNDERRVIGQQNYVIGINDYPQVDEADIDGGILVKPEELLVRELDAGDDNQLINDKGQSTTVFYATGKNTEPNVPPSRRGWILKVPRGMKMTNDMSIGGRGYAKDMLDADLDDSLQGYYGSTVMVPLSSIDKKDVNSNVSGAQSNMYSCGGGSYESAILQLNAEDGFKPRSLYRNFENHGASRNVMGWMAENGMPSVVHLMTGVSGKDENGRFIDGRLESPGGKLTFNNEIRRMIPDTGKKVNLKWLIPITDWDKDYTDFDYDFTNDLYRKTGKICDTDPDSALCEFLTFIEWNVDFDGDGSKSTPSACLLHNRPSGVCGKCDDFDNAYNKFKNSSKEGCKEQLIDTISGGTQGFAVIEATRWICGGEELPPIPGCKVVVKNQILKRISYKILDL